MSRFPNTYCSQCGLDLGPGDAGVSSCADHMPIRGQIDLALERIDVFEDSAEVAVGVSSMRKPTYPHNYWAPEGATHILGQAELIQELARLLRVFRATLS